MLFWLKKDTFIKDVFGLLLISVLCAGIFAMGFAMTTDKYFAKAVTGIIGDFGQYDLLFQTREELKGAMARQIREVIGEHFPGATLRTGISVVGKATFFLTLPSQYKTKEVFNNLSNYFNNLPGDGDFSIMTEPRINISSVPSGIFKLLSQEVEQLRGVRFTYKDGSSIGIILRDAHNSEAVLGQIKKLLAKYQILEVRLSNTYAPEEMMMLGKKVSQGISGVKGVDLAQDITMASGTDDYQYMVDTLLQVKKFLMAYAAEVKVQPNPGETVEVGDLLALNGQNPQGIRPGKLLQPLEVVVKVLSKDAGGIRGIIIQGDASFLKDNIVYKVLPGDKIGRSVGSVEVSDRKSQLVYAMDQGIKLLTQLNGALIDFNKNTGGAGLTVGGIEKAYGRLADVRRALSSVKSGVNGLSGTVDRENLGRMVNLLDGVGDDFDYLAKTFGRAQLLQNRFDQALEGLQGAKFLLGSSTLQNALGATGGIGDKLQLLNGQLSVVENSLRGRIQKLDDFINRFNPLVSVLVSWRNKAKDLALAADNFGATFTPGSKNYKNLTGLIQSTDQVLSNLAGFNLSQVKTGLNVISDHLFGSDKIDLAALIAQLQRMRDSLPKLLDEEIGRSLNLIDKYAGDAPASGQQLQIFTKAHINQERVNGVIKDAVGGNQMGIYSLPVGTIQPDIRGELFKILAEVRSTIAALVLVILWVLSFILDQSLIISMLKLMNISWLPKRYEGKSSWSVGAYQLLGRVISPANLYATIIGGIWLAASFAVAGARIPYLNFWIIGLLGGLLGMVISTLAEKINPICKDEVMAGLSLGLPFKTIMREIVIPSGRPGLLQFLNRWKMVMK